MRDWAHTRICNVQTVTRTIARLLTTKPRNIYDCVDIVSTSSIFLRQCFKLRKRLGFTQAIYITEIYLHILKKV